MIDDLVDRWQAAWLAPDPGAFSAVCAPDVHYEDPLCVHALDGPEAIAEHAVLLRSVFPDVRIERTGQRLTDGRFVAAPCRLLGTHAGDVDGLPATGRFAIVNAVVYGELDPDRRRLWRARTFFDAFDAAVQLGILPERGTLAERALLLLRGFGLRSRT